MQITALMENTGGNHACVTEHGLSLYIESANHKILMDTGSSNAFLENAKHLGIQLEDVALCLLSHGHYDHAGGILGFAKVNPKAFIYLHKLAGEDYYHDKRYIGIDKEILALPQIRQITADDWLKEDVFVFTNVQGRRLWPEGNKALSQKVGETLIQDEFLHEQYLVISEGEKRVLVSGCAHNGILNILERYYNIFQNYPTAVVSGFHMMKKTGYTDEDVRNIKETAEELKDLPTLFYTGHCTGEEPYNIMREIMGNQITYLHCGNTIQI